MAQEISGGERMKKCTGCKEVKHKEQFTKRSTKEGSYRSRCKECTFKKDKIYQGVNCNLIKEKRHKRYLKNKKIENEASSNYSKNNQGRINAKTSKRRALKLQATPDWLTAAQLEEMVDIYKQAKELEQIFFNRKFHVDHIVPLQGKDVCGLHVPWNLQILTAEENIKKGNRL